MRRNLGKDRIGMINKNTYGSLMEIIEYNKAIDVWVRFLETGNLVHTRWEHFCKGIVKNPYDISVYGVGFIGEGGYTSSLGDGKHTPHYNKWVNMLMRCYDEKYQDKNLTYIGCSVCEEWHNFQNFAAWYDQNFYQIDDELMELDKDILIKGNKIYSPDTCIFVNHSINGIFTKSDVTRGNLPIGVTFSKRDKMYVAKYWNVVNGKREGLGSYITPEEAFIVYKTHKEKYIKLIAKEYKSKIPVKIYHAMMNYEVEISD